MNKQLICQIMGFLFIIEGVILTLCSSFGFTLRETDSWAFVWSGLITMSAGILCQYYGRDASRQLNRRGGYLIVALSWVSFSVFGMLPYLFSGHISNVTDAFFETMSGFSTTGATILDKPELLPHGLLFWRSLTQWIGGLGIVFFTIAVLPIFGVGGIKLFAAEATGPTHSKISPRIEVTARWIWIIYVVLTAAELFLLHMAGMGWFDSACHALTTTATGGFSTHSESITYFHLPAVEYIITVFMFLSGINFTLIYYTFIKGRIGRMMHDTEVKYYFSIVVFLTTAITISLFLRSPLSFETSFRQASFQVVSILTTTGFTSTDYMLWPPVLWTMIALIMFIGACSGSTSGGIKCIRIAIMCKSTVNEFKRIIHPNAILPLRINKQVVSPNLLSLVLAFTFIYIGVVFVGWIIMVDSGLTFRGAFGIAISSISNVGPALGQFGPASSWSQLPVLAKWVSAFLMLIGRLELFSILLLFTPGFWKKRY